MTYAEELKAILDEVAKDINPELFFIGGSGGMMARNARRARDLDLFVPTRVWFALMNTDNWEVFIPEMGTHRQYDPPFLIRHYGDMEVNVFHHWRYRISGQGNWDVEHIRQHKTEVLSGYRFTVLPELLAWKRSANREKDQPDIAWLERQIAYEEIYPRYSRGETIAGFVPLAPGAMS